MTTTQQHELPFPVATRPFEGQAALVTGATSGIGRAIARVLAARGAYVIVSGQDEARGSSVVKEIRADGGQADFVAANLALDASAVRDFAARAAAAAGGRVDILVNNAGIYPATATADLPDGDLDAMLAVNIRSPHVLVAALAPAMADRGSGVIVTIGSWMAAVGGPFAALYSATKAADEQMTRSWAAEFGPRGVRVNAVAPGRHPDARERIRAAHPQAADGGNPGRAPGRPRGHCLRRRLPRIRRGAHDSRHHPVRRWRHHHHPAGLTRSAAQAHG